VSDLSGFIYPGATPRDITVGPDGNLWFTEQNAARVARIVLTNPTPPTPAPTPSVPPASVPAPPASGPVPSVQVVPTPTLKPSRVVGGSASLVIAAAGGRSRVVSLRAKGMTRGSRAVIRCLRGCAMRKSYATTKSSRDFTDLFRGRLLRPGASIALRVTKAGLVGREFRWRIVGHRLSSASCRVSTRGILSGCTTRLGG
jgi:hypothetical protein